MTHPLGRPIVMDTREGLLTAFQGILKQVLFSKTKWTWKNKAAYRAVMITTCLIENVSPLL